VHHGRGRRMTVAAWTTDDNEGGQWTTDNRQRRR
jgi:hypothetical protein